MRIERLLNGRRDDIQGLRAFAVIAVLLFHVDVSWMQGGYLGVDVFFVISGFLITHIIIHDVVTKKLTLSEFYLRRIRRLLPASVVTIAITMLAGGMILSTHDMMSLGKSAIFATFSASNILFWLESGYFDGASHLKPLLHTWSLGVEEQFYLVWPALIIALWSAATRFALAAIICLAFASLVVAEAYLGRDPSAAFFLMPFRVFEFAAGAILCFIPRLNPTRVADFLYVVGLILLVYSCVELNASYPMPGLLSLLPVLGTMLCIATGASRSARLLGIAPARFLGDISYSLYLVHWPIIVFWKYLTGIELSIAAQATLVAASLATGYLLHIAVEDRMRFESFWKGRIVARSIPAMLFLLLTLGAASNAWSSNGWTWRVPEAIRQATSDIDRVKARRGLNADKIRRLGSLKSPRIVIIGDSHAYDVASALYQNGVTDFALLSIDAACQPVVGKRPLYRTEKMDQTCEKKIRTILKNSKVKRAEVVVLSARWRSWSAKRIQETVKALRSRSDAKIVVFGPTVEFEPILPTLVEAYGGFHGIDAYAARYEISERRKISDTLRRQTKNTQVLYVNKFEILCERGKPCPAFVPGTEKILTFDYGHWSLEAAAYFGRKLKESQSTASKLLFNS